MGTGGTDGRGDAARTASVRSPASWLQSLNQFSGPAYRVEVLTEAEDIEQRSKHGR